MQQNMPIEPTNVGPSYALSIRLIWSPRFLKIERQPIKLFTQTIVRIPKEFFIVRRIPAPFLRLTFSDGTVSEISNFSEKLLPLCNVVSTGASFLNGTQGNEPVIFTFFFKERNVDLEEWALVTPCQTDKSQ